ncbi:WS/DGAT/MGAT family O-acyltransferase [Spongorhabdus nitratireducens]
MQQLSALDAAFVNMETGTAPSHVGSLGIYDQSTASSHPVRFKDIIKAIRNRLHKLPELRQRYVGVPMGLDYGYWIADPNFDIEFHLRHIALPAPGDWRQLCIQVARLHARHLDMNRPPWEIYIIEGLDNIEGIPKGSFAVVTKFHHGLIDGQAGAKLMGAMHDLVADPVLPPCEEPLIADRMPTAVELLARASINNSKNLLKSSKIVAKYSLPLARKATSVVTKKLTGKKNSSLIPKPPRVRFNQKISPHRSFEAIDFKLDEIKAAAAALPGLTVNDIALGIISGAQRRYLDDKGELPDASLNALVPVNIATDGRDVEGKNKISFMFPNIHTNIADPKERLLAINSASKTSKSNNKAMDGRALLDATQLLPNSVTNLIIRNLSHYNLMRHLPLTGNSVITNVMGPKVPLYFAGAKMVRFYGLGLPQDNVGLFNIIFTYNGLLSISATSCREVMPDPAFYMECMHESFEEIKAALFAEEEPVETEAQVDQAEDEQPEEVVEVARAPKAEPEVILKSEQTSTVQPLKKERPKKRSQVKPSEAVETAESA